MANIYDVGYVKEYLARPHFLLTGLDLRVFSKMGDSVAIAVLRVLFPDQAMDDLKLKKILAAVCAAMEHPSDIAEVPDRTPAITLCLLKSLAAEAKSQSHRDSVKAAMERIRTYRQP